MTKVETNRRMTKQLLPRIKCYDDVLNNVLYICDAPHGSALTDPVRNISKQQKTGLRGDEVQETGY